MWFKEQKIGIKQHDITDCGAACLASVAAYYELKMPIARIRQYASTDKKGTNVLGMIEAAEQLGFTAKGVKGDFESLFKIPTPAVAHILLKEVLYHYVVLYEANDQHIVVMDPRDGKLHNIPHEEFKKQWTGVLVLLMPDGNFQKGNEKISITSRLWYLLKPHRKVLLQALFGAAVFTIIGLSTAIFVQLIVDHVLPEQNENLLNLLGIGMCILLVLQIFIGTTKTIFTLKTGQLIDARLILGYYKHLLKLPQQFFDTMRVGEIISRINDAVKIRTFINDVSINLAVNLFVVLFSFGLMFTYFWKLGLVMLAIIPMYMIVYAITNTINRKTQRNVMEDAADLESQLVESLNSVSTIKQFGLEEFANLKTENRFVRLLKSIYRSGLNSVFASNASAFISKVFTIILLWLGAYYVMVNVITTGELMSFYSVIGYFTGPAEKLIGMNKTIQDAIIAGDRLFEIMDLEKEQEGKQVELQDHMIGDIVFKNVKFRYGSRVTVFDNLSITIPKGRVTAFVGESGSGKTTIINILQKLYPLDDGKVLIGNMNLDYMTNASLRKQISVVPQTVDLFAGNVIENIAVGVFEPDMQHIINICQDLGILDFIEDLPHGFETYLGENGATLSGGQKQRIAIARALYTDPEILILDEATSSLDSSSEQHVQRALQVLKKKDKTIILIAHRLSTVFHADKICVLSEGQIAEEGTHQELMANEEEYYQLWQKQFPILNGTSLAELKSSQ
ncbi:peptidase domain-containing ABC transporter [Fodinibius sediminis]